eukprot:scaffold112238_cov63-Phaeocystis_antarctica.AAC.3
MSRVLEWIDGTPKKGRPGSARSLATLRSRQWHWDASRAQEEGLSTSDEATRARVPVQSPHACFPCFQQARPLATRRGRSEAPRPYRGAPGLCLGAQRLGEAPLRSRIRPLRDVPQGAPRSRAAARRSAAAQGAAHRGGGAPPLHDVENGLHRCGR